MFTVICLAILPVFTFLCGWLAHSHVQSDNIIADRALKARFIILQLLLHQDEIRSAVIKGTAGMINGSRGAFDSLLTQLRQYGAIVPSSGGYIITAEGRNAINTYNNEINT